MSGDLAKELRGLSNLGELSAVAKKAMEESDRAAAVTQLRSEIVATVQESLGDFLKGKASDGVRRCEVISLFERAMDSKGPTELKVLGAIFQVERGSVFREAFVQAMPIVQEHLRTQGILERNAPLPVVFMGTAAIRAEW